MDIHRRLFAGLVKEYMRDPGKQGVSVDILSIFPPFVPLEAFPSILILPSVVPYVNGLDRAITVDITFNPRLILAFINTHSRFAIY